MKFVKGNTFLNEYALKCRLFGKGAPVLSCGIVIVLLRPYSPISWLPSVQCAPFPPPPNGRGEDKVLVWRSDKMPTHIIVDLQNTPAKQTSKWRRYAAVVT